MNLCVNQWRVGRGVLTPPAFSAPLVPDGALRTARPTSVTSSARAFTLIEMLVVLGIIGVLAALTLPSFNKAGKGNVIVTASRQLMDDLAYARVKAMSQRTKVYVVFAPDLAFFTGGNPLNAAVTNYFTANQAANDLLGGQLTMYALYSPRMVGEQPGQSTPRYLGEWRSLPDGAFIPKAVFRNGGVFHNAFGGSPAPFNAPILVDDTGADTNTMSLPFIAFDESGRLFGRTTNIAIPVIEGSILHTKDATGATNAVVDTDAVETSAPILPGGIVAGIEYFVAGTPGSQINYPSVGLVRAGQSFTGTVASATYTVPGAGARVVQHYAVRIDCLTGRARLVQPEIR